jgi:hypothetical protein
MIRQISISDLNEVTFENPAWKKHYFGGNYDEFLQVKNRLFRANASVGSDDPRALSADKRMCRVQ